MNNKKYIDCLNQCNECEQQFIIRVYKDGTYDYLTEPCQCESEFLPYDDELSISQVIETLKGV